MDKIEIMDQIKMIDEIFGSDLFKIKKIDINCNILKKIINKKKSENIINLFDELSINNNNQKTSPSQSSNKSPTIESSTIESSSIKNDSIAATNFTIPSSIYDQTVENQN
jgi:hypothetical protein